MGKESVFFFFFFFRKGPWLEAFSFCAFSANLSGFQLLIWCVFIGMKAAPDYESGRDVVSGIIGISLGLDFFLSFFFLKLLICVNSGMVRRSITRQGDHAEHS